MKLLSYVDGDRPKWGAVAGGGIVDFSRRCDESIQDLRSYIAAGLPNAETWLAQPADTDIDQVEFLPVVPNPSKIIMAALNYSGGERQESARPDYPVLFLRLAETQIGHGAPMVKPRVSDRLDFEGELAVVIGRSGREIPAASAMDHVAGYSCYNDGSVRDWQRHSHQFTPGKNFMGTGGFGPWLVTADEIADPMAGLGLITRVNGVEKQKTDTSKMIFDVCYLISYISTFVRLDPGDVIVTGTCSGFGSTRKPPEFLSPGDVVDVEIESIGTLTNSVVAQR